MSKIEKMIERMKTVPADYSYKELESLLLALGFTLSNKGRSSGSRVKFEKDGAEIILHKPHPSNEIKRAYLREIVRKLKKEGLI